VRPLAHVDGIARHAGKHRPDACSARQAGNYGLPLTCVQIKLEGTALMSSVLAGDSTTTVGSIASLRTLSVFDSRDFRELKVESTIPGLVRR